MRKTVVTAALTGALTRREHCPAIPYTPVEIAEEARRAYGTVILTEAWNPYLPVMWWLVFVLAVWSIVSDDPPMLRGRQG